MGKKTEDERIERVIRGLLKLPENRRCINCNLLGPLYVCTTFSTFVCTNCSGIHREFTHRVKSVSMAKFTPEEVTALQAGGNERAKQIYFKEWDSLRNSYPDSCNIHRLRDFIKHVYVDRRFGGEMSSSSFPMISLKDKEESYGSRKSSSFRFEFKSPQSSPGLSARSDDTSFRYIYDETRSPRYAQKYSRHGGYSRSPIKFEVVDDRFKDDEYRNRRLSNLESKLKHISINGQKNVDKLPPPVARPLGDIIGENASSLQVTPSGGDGSVEKKTSEHKANNPESLTDLSIKPHTSDATEGVGPETPRISPSNESNWASFEVSTEKNVPQNPKTNTLQSSTKEATFANPLDLLLFELSGPLNPAPGGKSQVPIGDNGPTTTTVENAITWDFPPQTTSSLDNSGVRPFTSTTTTELAKPSSKVLSRAELNDTHDSIKVSHAHELPNMQYLPSVSVGCNSITQPANSQGKASSSNNQPSVSLETHDSSAAFTEQSLQTTSQPTQDTKPNAVSQANILERRSNGRMELLEDLFTVSFSSGPAPFAGWQNVQPHALGYGMQYNPNALPPSALPIAPMSSNPFEVTEGRSLMHVSSFPNMASMNGVLPGASPRARLIHASSSHGSLGTLVPQSSNYSSPATQRSPFASGVPMGVYFDQVNNEEQANRPQRFDNINGDMTGLGSLINIQQSFGGYVTPRTPYSFSNTKGNPFE